VDAAVALEKQQQLTLPSRGRCSRALRSWLRGVNAVVKPKPSCDDAGAISPHRQPTRCAQPRRGSIQALDLNVAATLIRHGNYDDSTRSIVWDPRNPVRSIPNSYFRATRPAYFASLPWPQFDPGAPPGAVTNDTLARIPAGYRYVNATDPR
jgi:hypothetical protein